MLRSNENLRPDAHVPYFVPFADPESGHSDGWVTYTTFADERGRTPRLILNRVLATLAYPAHENVTNGTGLRPWSTARCKPWN